MSAHDPPQNDLERLLGPDRRALGLAWIPLLLAIAAVGSMVALWPDSEDLPDLAAFGVTPDSFSAEVTEVIEGGCSYDPDSPCVVTVFELLEGPLPGSTALQEFEVIPSTPDLAVGDRVILDYIADADPEFQYVYADRERRGLLVTLTIVFVAAVVALGRWRGLAALGGLAASVLVVVGFAVPSILGGEDPVLVAASAATAIALISLYLAHGFTPLTHVALFGTVAALALTIALSAVTTAAADFSGLAGEEGLYLTLVGGIDVRGLVLAGIVLGALGALDDVTVTQASTVWELRRANPDLSESALLRAGLRVGRDHIASTVNTLLLAYAGASMPLLLLFGLSRQRLGVIANSEVVATEIVRTLVGSIGLVAAVPITTWLAARIAARRDPRELVHAH